MSTQQDIYAAGSKNRPPMLNKDNYVPWSSRLLRYAKNKSNGKLIYDSITKASVIDDELTIAMNMALALMAKAFKLSTPTNNNKRISSNPRNRQIAQPGMNMGQDRHIQNVSGNGGNQFGQIPHPNGNQNGTGNVVAAAISSSLTIFNLNGNDTSPLFEEVNELRAKRLTKTHDPLALMAHSQNFYNYPVIHSDQPSPSSYMQQPLPNNNYNPQPSFNQNYVQQTMINLDNISDPTIAMNMALALMAKAFKLSTPTNNNKRISSNPRNRQIVQPGMNMGQDRHIQNVRGNGGNQFGQYIVQNVGNQVVQNPGVQNVGNQNGLIVFPRIPHPNRNQNGTGNVVAARAEGTGYGYNDNQIRCYNCRGLGHYARNCTVRPRRRDAAYLQTQLLIAQKEEAKIQLQAEEYDLMSVAADINEIEEVNANCILMANLQQASTSGIQTDKAPIYDSDGSAEVHCDNGYNNDDIFNMFTQEDQYYELREPIPESHLVQQNDSDVITAAPSVEQSGGIVEQHFATVEEIHASAKTITTLKEEIANLNNQLSKEKSIVSFLQEEKKRLKSNFKTREDELHDKQIQLEQKIKELDNILVKMGQSIQMMHMLSPKPGSFYHTEHKIALGYQNPFYLKQAQQKQQSLYNGKVLLEKHDPPVVYDSEETLQLA
ncbi:retrovirus-related pol polyprotein from transposon TNT 1-94 [Tanacetum coccineum]